jgi:putative transposase
LPGQRKAVPYENPCGRRINAVGILIPEGPESCLIWDHVPRSIRSEDILAMLEGIPRRGVPIVVVLDNAQTHRSKVIQAAQVELAAQQIEFYYLPPYSPELNAIEAVFGGIKHHDLPERRYAELDHLGQAINQAFTHAEARLLARHPQQIRPAA